MLRKPREIGFTWPVIGLVIFLHIAGTLFEGIGLAILLPVFEIIQSGKTAEALAAESGLWRRLVGFYSWFDLTVTIPVLLATCFVAIIARQAMIYVRMMYEAHAMFGVVRKIRDRAFRAFLHTRLGYADREGMGRIVNDLTTETQGAVVCAYTSITLIGLGATCSVYIGVLFALSIDLTVAAIVVMGIAVLPLLRLLRLGRRAGERLVQANSALLHFLSERLKSARLIRLSNTEAAEFDRMKAHTAEQFTRLIQGRLYQARAVVILEPVVVASALVFLYLGVSQFGMKLGTIGLFLVIIVRMVPVVRSLMNQRYQVASNMGSLVRVIERLRGLDAAAETDSGTVVEIPLSRGIVFDNVRFRYADDETEALSGVSLTLPANRVTALVGSSGSGKSTLIDMLPRLRHPDSGTIRFDDTPVGEFALEPLRRAISYAPQSPQIFNVAVREHIRYGQPGADQATIERAARLAGAHEFIVELKDGYDTVVTEAGGSLSGGQRQRLDLARTLLKPAKILIFDEPTSQLDAESENKFREALLRIKEETDLTIIIVGHRFATVSIADQIVVLNNGRVEDVGTHAELVKRDGWYKRAHERQTRAGATQELVVG